VLESLVPINEHGQYTNLNHLDFALGHWFAWVEYFMARPLAKPPFVLFALCLWILACSASLGEDDEIQKGKYQKEISFAEKSVETAKRIWGPEEPATADALDDLGLLLKKDGNYVKAEPLFQEALRICRKVLGSEDRSIALSLSNLAFLYKTMGEYAKAEPLYQEALRIRQEVLGFEHPDTAKSFNYLALLYVDMGEYGKAEPLYQEAFRIKQKALGAEDPSTATSINNLAGLYQDMGEYGKAEPLYQEALRIKQKVLGPENPGAALGLNNLANLYKEMGAYGKAEPFLQEALDIFRKVRGPEHPDTATSINNLAALYDDMGEYAKAEPLCQEALRIDQKVLRAEDPRTAVSLHNLAYLYKRMGQYAKAEPLYQQALRIWQEVLGPEHPDTAKGLENLAYLEFDLGRIGDATALARQASAAQLTILSKIFSFTSEEQRLAYLDIFSPYGLFPILKGTETDLATAVLRYKGVVLDSIVEDRLLAEISKTSQDRELLARLDADKRQLGQLLLQTPNQPSGDLNKKIEALEHEVDQLEGQLTRHAAGLGRARRALSVTVEQVQAILPQDGALIEYVRYGHYLGKSRFEGRYGAVVLTETGPARWVPLGNARDVDAIVNRYQALVRNASDQAALSESLESLYARLWSPIERVLPPGVKQVRRPTEFCLLCCVARF
jgi:tetratricopeptide (TPR) repeat protein